MDKDMTTPLEQKNLDGLLVPVSACVTMCQPQRRRNWKERIKVFRTPRAFQVLQVRMEDRGSTASTASTASTETAHISMLSVFNLNPFYFCVGTGRNEQNDILSRTILGRILRRCSRAFG